MEASLTHITNSSSSSSDRSADFPQDSRSSFSKDDFFDDKKYDAVKKGMFAKEFQSMASAIHANVEDITEPKSCHQQNARKFLWSGIALAIIGFVGAVVAEVVVIMTKGSDSAWAYAGLAGSTVVLTFGMVLLGVGLCGRAERKIADDTERLGRRLDEKSARFHNAISTAYKVQQFSDAWSSFSESLSENKVKDLFKKFDKTLRGFL